MASSNFWPAPRRLTGLTKPMGFVSVKMMVGFVMSVRLLKFSVSEILIQQKTFPNAIIFDVDSNIGIIHLCLVPQDIYQKNRLAGV